MMNVTPHQLTMASERDLLLRHANASANAKNMKDASTHLQEMKDKGFLEKIIIDQLREIVPAPQSGALSTSLAWGLLFLPVAPHLIRILIGWSWLALGRILLLSAIPAPCLRSNLLSTETDHHHVEGIYHQFQYPPRRRRWPTVSGPRLVGAIHLHLPKETISGTVLLQTPGRRTKCLLLKGRLIIMVILVALQVVQAEGITTGPILATRLLGHLLLRSPCPPIIVLAAHLYSPRLLVHEVCLPLAEKAEAMGHIAGPHRAVAIRSIRHTTGHHPVIKGTNMDLHMGIAMIHHHITPADLLPSNIALHFVPTTALRQRIPAHSAFPRTFRVFLQLYLEAKQRPVVWILLPRNGYNN